MRATTPAPRRSPLALRLGAATLFFAVAGALGTALVASCGTDAVGVTACREVESARCTAAQSCPGNTIDLTECKNFYHDECLHGIENSDFDGGDPETTQVNACVHAVHALEACIKAGGKTMGSCRNLSLNEAYDPEIKTKTPCDVLETEPEALTDCSFVIPTDAGVSDAADAGNDAFIL